MNPAETLLLIGSGLALALIYGSALLVVLADLRLPSWLLEVMNTHPPYRGVRRWLTLVWVGPMSALGVFLLFAPVTGVRGANPGSSVSWIIVIAAWGIFAGAVVMAMRRLVTL